MDRVVTATALAQLTSADFNNIQDRALGIAQVEGVRWGGDSMRVTTTQISVSKIAIQPSGNELVRTAQTPATYTIGTLTADTWYYVYVYDNAGTLTIELSTTAPDVSLQYKDGDKTRVYVGPVLTKSTTTFVPAVKHGRRYLWRHSGLTESMQGGNVSGTTSITTISLQASAVGTVNLFPPHVQMVDVKFNIANTSGADAYFDVFTESDTNAAQNRCHCQNGNSTIGPMACDVGTTGVLKVQPSHASLSITAWPHGFWE